MLYMGLLVQLITLYYLFYIILYFVKILLFLSIFLLLCQIISFSIYELKSIKK